MLLCSDFFMPFLLRKGSKMEKVVKAVKKVVKNGKFFQKSVQKGSKVVAFPKKMCYTIDITKREVPTGGYTDR